MFDVSFSELIVIGIVALVVIGPERLPKVARTAGHLMGRLQRYVNDVKSDISREMQLDELKKLKAEGVTAGVPDLFVPGRRAFIEVKKPGGRISPAQRDMMVKLRLLGYDCIVAYSVEDVERFFALQGDKL